MTSGERNGKLARYVLSKKEKRARQLQREECGDVKVGIMHKKRNIFRDKVKTA